MYMFLPFLIALGVVLSAVMGKKKLGYVLWVALLLITVASFKYHATDYINLSF